MAYCRMSGGCDVYMYHSVFGGYQFHLARSINLKDPEAKSDFLIKDPKAALRKLKRLQTQGFGVPQYAIDRLAGEIAESESVDN